MSIDELITYLDSIVGDVPVSEQLSIALNQMAKDTSVQELRDEINELKKQVSALSDLVGDIPVSEQIYSATNNK